MVQRPITLGGMMNMKTLGAALLVSVATMLSMPASAADLGGNCCADLEERIGELEATTARKGNRKVSLAISGWVAEQITVWDDGTETNTYVAGLGSTLASHFKLTVKAQIVPGWSAGYVMHVEALSAEQAELSQVDDDGRTTPNILQSYWFLQSDRLGKVSVGLVSQASDNAAILVDSSGTLVAANWVLPFDTGGFRFRNANGTLSNLGWSDVTTCGHIGASVGGDCNGVPLNAVRYDTPTFAGFSASASWGEDDFWDVAVRYAGELSGFKVAVTAAYSEFTDETGLGGRSDVQGRLDSGYFQVGAYVQHIPTGLWAFGAYGHEDNNFTYVGGFRAPDEDIYHIKAGIRRTWTPLGHTVLYGEYGNFEDQLSAAALGAGITSSEVENWGLGIVQEIDAAAMSIWLKYRHVEADLTGAPSSLTNSPDDIDFVSFGALINF